jgi:hypothetical protein
MFGVGMRLASTKNTRAFVMAYVLARQYTGCKRSAAKTNTPLNALFCGVFRLYLLLLLPNKCHIRRILASYGAFISKPPDFGNLVRIFQAVV